MIYTCGFSLTYEANFYISCFCVLFLFVFNGEAVVSTLRLHFPASVSILYLPQRKCSSFMNKNKNCPLIRQQNSVDQSLNPIVFKIDVHSCEKERVKYASNIPASSGNPVIRKK